MRIMFPGWKGTKTVRSREHRWRNISIPREYRRRMRKQEKRLRDRICRAKVDHAWRVGRRKVEAEKQ